MGDQAILWTVFSVMVVAALAIDLGVFQRKAHVVKAREALIWTCVWISLAMVFDAIVWHYKGPDAASKFLAGFLIEKSLSVDNLFVFIMIFSYFSVPQEYEARILLWGILGALIMRAIFIVGGSALMNAFHWMPYVFGVILVYTGFKLLVKKDEDIHPDRNPVLRLFKRYFPVTTQLDGQRFFSRVPAVSTPGGGGEGGASVALAATRLVATPLFVVLIVVETTDVIFAVDSIPAIFAITTDPFIVYTSNVFAILGLRALYFLLARMMNVFRFLKYGLVIILWFVGVKMILEPLGIHVSIGLSLSVIGGVLLGSVVLSIAIPPAHQHLPPLVDLTKGGEPPKPEEPPQPEVPPKDTTPPNSPPA